MTGKGRHQLLGVCSADPVVSVAASVGLAASAGTALLVDLASTPMSLGKRTLADLAGDGPSIAELSPGRAGVAMIGGGGLAAADAEQVLGLLATRWPAMVVRVDLGDWSFPVVPVVPLYPGRLAPVAGALAGVWQPVAPGTRPPGPGPMLPRLRASSLRRILSGQPPRRDRWLAAWEVVWTMPWA